MNATARALWVSNPGTVEIRAADLGNQPGTVLVETLYSGISRGTEALVFAGRVPEAEWRRMACPFQEGRLPFPVKYGYAAVGIVADGPRDLVGRAVFCLHPHQDRFRTTADALVPVPDGVPPGRAILAANMETALTIAWDSGAGPGDRIAVVGAGTVGLLSASLLAGIPGTAVTVVDINPARAAVAAKLACGFADPAGAPADCDVVVHASASAAGLATAIGAAGTGAAIVEASWYGDGPVPVALGGAFHSRRLSIVASQVGCVPPRRATLWTARRRLEMALDLLRDDRLDSLISGETDFEDLPSAYAGILGDSATLCHRIRYPNP